MKRRDVMLILMVCVAMSGGLMGCEKTPDEVIVTEKNKDNIADYESAKSTDEKIKDVMSIPETYQNQVASEDGSLVIDTDAVVEVPDVSGMNTIEVSAIDFDQKVIDQVTESFFGDSPVYSSSSYYAATKVELQERLDELKQARAEGDMESFGYGPGEDVNEDEMNAIIENLEKQVAEAPETVEKEEIQPQFGLDDGIDNEVQVGERPEMDYFDGIVEMDGAVYSYSIQNMREFMMESNIRISRNRDLENDDSERYGEWYEIAEEKNQSELTLEQAKEKADEIAEKLQKAVGIEGLQIAAWNSQGFCYSDETEDEIMIDDPIQYGYQFHYARQLEGVPIVYTDSSGGGLEDMESTTEPWSYETCDIIVSADGLEKVYFDNPYQIGGVKSENVKLLDFDTVIKNYEDMMLISNADLSEYEKKRTYHINRITLGYARIYDPTTDNLSGVLVPVWDFFGGFEIEGTEDEYSEDYEESADGSTQSMLTINAVDGTIINRELGY